MGKTHWRLAVLRDEKILKTHQAEFLGACPCFTSPLHRSPKLGLMWLFFPYPTVPKSSQKESPPVRCDKKQLSKMLSKCVKNFQRKTIENIENKCGSISTVQTAMSVGQCIKQAIPENREMKKMKFSCFGQRHALSRSFSIFMVTYIE